MINDLSSGVERMAILCQLETSLITIHSVMPYVYLSNSCIITIELDVRIVLIFCRSDDYTYISQSLAECRSANFFPAEYLILSFVYT